MSDEKTEEGSQQKFQDARDKGQAARSQDLSQACGQLLAVLFLGGFAVSVWDGLTRGLTYNLGHLGQDGVGAPLSMLAVWKLVGIALTAGLVGGVMSHYASVGWMLTSHPIQPDLNRLNPLQNGKRFFSPKIMVEATRLFLKVGGSLAIAWGYLEHDWIATKGTFIFEPAGETHTLVVDPKVGHMTTLFHNMGPLLYVDENGKQTGYTRSGSSNAACG